MSDYKTAQTSDPYRTPTSGPSKSDALGVYSSDEKTWSLIAHLSPLIGFVVPIPLANIIAPVVVWILKREELPMVDDQAKEAINFQITLFLMGIVCFALVFVFIGIILLPLLVVYGVVMSVFAAKAVQEGKLYRYPMTLRLI